MRQSRAPPRAGRAEPILTHLLDDRVLRVRAAAEAALAALVISQAPG
jgi:hypothetical protein